MEIYEKRGSLNKHNEAGEENEADKQKTSNDNPIYNFDKKESLKQFAKVFILFTFVSSSQYFVGILLRRYVTGHIEPEYMQGFGIGSLILGSLLGLLGFLRVATIGFSAQARGMKDPEKDWTAFFEPAILSLAFGILIILLQKPMLHGAIFLYKLPDNTAALASQ